MRGTMRAGLIGAAARLTITTGAAQAQGATAAAASAPTQAETTEA